MKPVYTYSSELKMVNNGTIISVSDAKKSFGAVNALAGVSLDLNRGECLGLVGHNGAGKSTLINILTGIFSADTGNFVVSDQDIGQGWSVSDAHKKGVRCIFQELSLCPNLTVAENLRIMHSSISGQGWRKTAGNFILAKLDEIFTDHGISPNDTIENLSIGARQMVEIARAFTVTDEPLHVVILDEPTSSLDITFAEQLLSYIEKQVAKGLSCIFVSHILGEVLQVSDRVVVMRDGLIVDERIAGEFSRDSLVTAMGSKEDNKAANSKVSTTREHKDYSGQEAVIQLDLKGRADRIMLEAFKGEIIGLAGLAGDGQTRALLELYRQDRSLGKDRLSFVAGDRERDGIFPLWSIAYNTGISSLKYLINYGFISRPEERSLAEDWKQKIDIRAPSIDVSITSLSGGNQQKVLFARVLASKAEIILMDDPLRGVDVGTRQDIYEIVKKQAKEGRTFIWYTTEIDELYHCDRVYVFRDQYIVAMFEDNDITEENVLSMSFEEEPTQ